jgi:3-phenylpropionate/cinnamic acid dioxygenase small subunit
MTYDRSATDAILTTVYDYVYALDEKRFDLFADCFTDKASIEIRVHDAEPPMPHLSGRDMIVDFFRTGRDAHRDRRRHVVTNPRVERNGEAATVHAYVTLYSTEDHTPRLLCTGQYLDELVDEGERWRISRKLIDLDSMYR